MALCLLVLVVTPYRYLLQTVTRTWFGNSDEYVMIAEIIRFAQGDFHQRFFDMPGTPYIVLVAAIWKAFLGLVALAAPSQFAGGPMGFTFQHPAWLFELARSTTLFFYGLSLILLFLVARKVIGSPGALLATLFLMMSRVYALYSGFIRVESMAVCMFLGAILLAYRALERTESHRRPSWRDLLVVSGFLAGIGAGVRLHSIFASVPLLWLIVVLQEERPRRPYPRWVVAGASWVLPILAATGAVLYFYAGSFVPPQMPLALALIKKATAAATVLPLLALGLYQFERTRALIVKLAPPEAIKTGLGCCVGMLAGIPTLIPQREFFFGSIQSYSAGYIDWERSAWPFLKHAQWLMGRYMNVAVPDRVALYLLLAGAFLILVKLDRKVLPYLISAAVFFFSRPLNLQPAQHHMILWLPAYAIICAYPVAQAYRLIGERVPNGPVWATAFFALAFAAITASLFDGPRHTVDRGAGAETRLANVAQATGWMKEHSVRGSSIAVAYYCFNPDVFYVWLQSLDVPGLPSAADGRERLIWWGRRKELAGRSGFACLTKADVIAVKAGIGPAEAGQEVDPYTDSRFERAVSFGRTNDQVDVFRFDFRER